MADKHLKGDPHKIKGRDDVWWYDGSDGISLVHEISKRPATHTLIPWPAIRLALARKDRPSPRTGLERRR